MLRQIIAMICVAALLIPAVPGQSPDVRQAPEQTAQQPASAPSAEQASSAQMTIPEGTEIQLSLREAVSSKLSEPGDEIYAVVRRDVVVDGRVILRQGTEIIGRVTATKPARRMLRGGMLHLSFDRVRTDTGEQKLSAIIKSASDFNRDEKIKSDGEGSLKGGKNGTGVLTNVAAAAGIGGAAASIIILAGASRLPFGSGIGAVAGGSAAAAASALGVGVIAGILLTKGKEVRLEPGTLIRLRLERPLAIG